MKFLGKELVSGNRYKVLFKTVEQLREQGWELYYSERGASMRSSYDGIEIAPEMMRWCGDWVEAFYDEERGPFLKTGGYTVTSGMVTEIQGEFSDSVDLTLEDFKPYGGSYVTCKLKSIEELERNRWTINPENTRRFSNRFGSWMFDVPLDQAFKAKCYQGSLITETGCFIDFKDVKEIVGFSHLDIAFLNESNERFLVELKKIEDCSVDSFPGPQYRLPPVSFFGSSFNFVRGIDIGIEFYVEEIGESCVVPYEMVKRIYPRNLRKQKKQPKKEKVTYKGKLKNGVRIEVRKSGGVVLNGKNYSREDALMILNILARNYDLVV